MNPSRERTDEGRLVTGGLGALAALALPVLAVAALLGGRASVAGALAGLLLVGMLVGGSAGLLRLVKGRSPATAVTTLVMGFVGRLLAYAVVLAVLGRIGGLDPTALALTAALGVVVALAYEVRLLSRLPRLFWIDADRERPRAVSNATRSQPL